MAKENPIPEFPVFDKKNDDKTTSDVSHVSPSSDGEPIVTQRELWSYYLYFFGGSGVPIFSTSTIFQNLATHAGYDPLRGPGSSCLDSAASGKCVLPWGSGTKPVSSILLLAEGISLALIAVMLTVIGPAADYGSVGRWPLLVATVIYWGLMFSTISLTSASHWALAMAIYTLGHTCYSINFAFYTANFPRLARNTRRIRELRERYDQGEVTAAVCEQEKALEKSRISSFSMASGAAGYVVILLLDLSLLIPLRGNAKVDNYVIVMSTAFGVMTGIWWFLFHQPRPGPELPRGERYFTIGWKQGLNTTTALVQICQNLRFSFSFLDNTYLSLEQTITAAIGVLVYWYAQRCWKIDSKKMLMATNIVAVVLPLWGMIGIWTNKLGYHSRWEFWAYNFVFGFFQTPYFAYSQTVMAELCPPGFDYMFFGLFGLTSRASSIIGPVVIQAIINKTDNTWQGFTFLFAICAASSLVIWLAVDVPKGRRDAELWAAEKRGTYPM